MNLPVADMISERVRAVLCACCVVVMLLAANGNSLAAEVRQSRFTTPDEAVQALVAATRADDLKAMLAILGPGSSELISSGDSVADNGSRDRFVASYDLKHSLETKSPGLVVLHVGADDWTMPIPLVKKGGKWGFDIGKGKKEILNRRIGRNELNVIDVLDAYVDAQHEYASKDCRGTGKVEFAQRFISTPGTRDGLYWETREGEQQSPLGPLLARAAREGYRADDKLSPFHGYYFKILTGQGRHAKGGAYSYVVKDKMILGFALVAYPAEYGNSGVMTFLVNQDGIVYEKNFGRDTKRIAEAIAVYNPDKSWKKIKVLETGAADKPCPVEVKK